MADLDDFFAKKDRKKSKTTKKFSTTDEVAKKLEDNAKKTEVKKKPDRANDGDETNPPNHEQDEWKEFEEEKKDYTGLKIGNLTINQNSEGQQGNVESKSDQQEGEEASQQQIDRKLGPWNKIEVEEAPVVEQAPPPPAPVVTGAYKPPSLRNPIQQHNRPSFKQRGAPDVHNEELFPTLSKTGDYRKSKNEGSFEVVQHNKSSSLRHSENSRMGNSQGPKLSLVNRYHTLSHDS